MNLRLPLYHVDRVIAETGGLFDDGEHILYVNGAFRDDSPVGKLMHNFSCTNPNDMHFGILADRVRFFKESEEGVAIMCRVMEEMRDKTLKEAMRATALRMLHTGRYALEEIVEISGLSLEEVKILRENKTA